MTHVGSNPLGCNALVSGVGASVNVDLSADLSAGIDAGRGSGRGLGDEERSTIEALVGFRVAGVSALLHDDATGESVRFVYGADGEFCCDYRLAPGGFVPFAHAHTRQSEIFDVKRGSFALCIDGVEVVAGPGSRHTVPAGAEHVGKNVGDEEVQIIVAFEPRLDAADLFERYWGLRARGCSCIGQLLLATCELQSRTYDAAIPRAVQDVARVVACTVKRLFAIQ